MSEHAAEEDVDRCVICGSVEQSNQGGLCPAHTYDEVECCASGRCEVCTPGFNWGRDG